jgi:uncharacterized protein (TIGR03067 family)
MGQSGAGPVAPEVARRLRYRFESSRVTLLEGERVTGAGTVAVHQATTPKAIDVEMIEGPGRGQVARGIYEIVEDRLRLCIGPERPTGFIPAGPDSVVELERAPIPEAPAV